ncbi:MAG: hypothetical protein VB859_18295 [Planctomycetaceae bacterium]
MNGRWLLTAGLCGLVLTACGCGDVETPGTSADGKASVADPVPGSKVQKTRTRRRGPVQLGGPASENDESGDSKDRRRPDRAGGIDVVMARMKPLQILLGRWQGLTNKQQVTVPQQWVWDLKSKPDQPALVLTSSESPFFRTGRLTWSADDDAFEFSGTRPDGARQVFRGRFSQPPRTVPGDSDDEPQLTYKLELTEVAAAGRKTDWKVVFNQQENNRLLVELSKRHGQAAFRRADTIGCQRDGTAFARSDTDYGEKTCVISQGLGTIAVSYQGKSYWVCCSGCKAAFEEEPEKWIARFEAMKQRQKKKS